MIKINVKNLDIKEVLFSGACFRVKEESDGSITNILKDRVVNLKQEGNTLYVTSSNEDNLENVIREYFDLNRDYESINKEILSRNIELSSMISKCKSYRILNQDSFEMGIAYIISQNNNVKRISNIIEELSKCYGKKITFNNNDYYLFPTYDELKDVSKEDLSKFKMGFRDKYILDYLEKYNEVKDLDNINTIDALNRLQMIKGIGLKVASCILLFGYKRLDVFPIDTWVRKYMVNNYNIKDEINVIREFTYNKFNPYTGLVIQYMFHSMRNTKEE